MGGTAVGGTAGSVGGGAIGYGVYGQRAEIAEGARKCKSYTQAKIDDVKAFVESKTGATKDVPRKRTVSDVAKKSRAVAAKMLVEACVCDRSLTNVVRCCFLSFPVNVALSCDTP